MSNDVRLELLRCGGLLRLLRSPVDAQIPAAMLRAREMLDGGVSISEDMRDAVRNIGKTFEFYREKFSPALVGTVEFALAALRFGCTALWLHCALVALYVMFSVAPVGASMKRDGVSAIETPPGTWQRQHELLWELLVPAAGPAAMLQGEVIRVMGKLSDDCSEMER